MTRGLSGGLFPDDQVNGKACQRDGDAAQGHDGGTGAGHEQLADHHIEAADNGENVTLAIIRHHWGSPDTKVRKMIVYG